MLPKWRLCALQLTAAPFSSDTDATYVAMVYESIREYTRLNQLIDDLNKREKVSKVVGAGDHLSYG